MQTAAGSDRGWQLGARGALPLAWEMPLGCGCCGARARAPLGAGAPQKSLSAIAGFLEENSS